MSYAPAKLAVDTYNGLGGDAFEKKNVTKDGRRDDNQTLVRNYDTLFF